MRILFLLFALSFSFFSCQPQATPEESKPEPAEDAHLGEVHLTVSGNKAALEEFEEGLLLLHSFEYSDAREAFLRAQEQDSSCVMAYWGEAMTYNHPLWRRQKTEEGQAALAQLAPTAEERLALAGSELEKDLLEAIHILFGEEGTKQERDEAYSQHLGQLHQKYPNNQEVAAFYALSILGAVPVGRDEEAYEQGARIAQGIIDENPNHPGALHYLIHSFDDPSHAPKAIHAANSYAKVAPDAAHALHMPSHIYVALGQWDNVVSSNIASWEASVKRMERKDLDDNARSFHALHWLMYGYLQQGRFAKAEQIMYDMMEYSAEEPNRSTRSYIVSMKGNYLVDSDNWDNAEINAMTTDLSDLNIRSRAAYHFIEGYKAYLTRNEQQLKTVINQMAKEQKAAANLVTVEGIPMCSAAGLNRNQPNQLDIDQARVMTLELEAYRAMLRNQDEDVERLLKEATQLESSISYSYGPPTMILPSYELYGEWLLSQDRPEAAAEQFDYALAKAPRRLRSLKGRLNAAIAANDLEKEMEIRATLKETLHQADEEVRSSILDQGQLSSLD